MKKISRKIICSILVILCLALCSCETSTSNIKVNSFTSSVSTYEIGDLLEFEVDIKNIHQYTIISFTINDFTYEAPESANSYDVYVLSDINNVFDGTIRFTLKELVYEKTVDSLNSIPEYYTEYFNETITVKETINTGNDISIISISTDSIIAYTAEESKIYIEIDNPKNYVVNVITLSYISIDGENENTIFSTNISESNFVYANDYSKFIIYENLPRYEGDYQIELSSIKYVKNTEMLTAAFDITTQIEIIGRTIDFLSVSVTNLNTFEKTLADEYAIDVNTTIEIEVELKNDDYKVPTYININSTKYSIEKYGSVKILSKGTYITIEVMPTDVATNEVYYQDIIVDSIIFEDNTMVVPTFVFEAEEEILVYDKIINTSSDLIDITPSTVSDNTVSGTYLFAYKCNLYLDISELSFFAQGYNFDGFLDGNGSSIILSTTLEQALFQTIFGTLQNFNFTIYSKNTNILCETNQGTIKNNNFTISIIHDNYTSKDKLGGLMNINDGTINDIKIMGVYSMALSVDSMYSLICNQNNGTIVRVIDELTSVVALDNNCYHMLHLTALENYGSINSVIHLFKNLKLDSGELYPALLVLDSENLENGTSTNLIVSDEILEYGTPDNFFVNFIVNGIGFDYSLYTYYTYYDLDQITFVSSTTVNSATSQTAYIEQLNFYITLGFNGNGTNCFWTFNYSISPKLVLE